jgi:hypothetical protein
MRIAGERCKPRYHGGMIDAQPRPSAPCPGNEYTLTINEVAELFAKAEHGRTIPLADIKSLAARHWCLRSATANVLRTEVLDPREISAMRR